MKRPEIGAALPGHTIRRERAQVLTFEQLSGRMERLKEQLALALQESPRPVGLVTRLEADLLEAHRDMADPRRSAVHRKASMEWTPRRAPPVDSDRVLISPTHVWLRSIPRAYQPKQLCIRYPRVANTLAESWADRAMGDRVLADLLVDTRGGRVGFPARIVEELQALRIYRERAHARGQTAERILRSLSSVLGRLPLPRGH